MKKTGRYALKVALILLPFGLLVWLLFAMVGGLVSARRPIP